MSTLIDVEGDLGTLRTYYLISGIANAVAMAAYTVFIVAGGIATCGVGCLLLVFPLVNLAVMILDFVASSKVLQEPDPGNYSFLRLASTLEIVACFALVPMIMGILSLQILAKPDIRRHFGLGLQGDIVEPSRF